MDMYRSIRQGMGMWTKEDDALYENFQKTGKWNGKLKPLKPSYEFESGTTITCCLSCTRTHT